MTRFSQACEIYRCLGPRWLAFRLAYAVRQRSGYAARRQPVVPWDAAPLAAALKDPSLADAASYSAFRQQSSVRFFFAAARLAEGRPIFAAWDAPAEPPRPTAERILRGEFPFFSHAWFACGRPPDWHRNPVTGQRAPDQGHWSQLNEFASGDIKLVWELSRFGWVFPLVRAYARTGDPALAECFWGLVEDWRAHNPPRAGVHWKCGQEVGLRVMAWCFGVWGFAGAKASSPTRVAGLAQMMAVSGERIAANISYALSQANNHGLSEAAALWTLGLLFPEFAQAGRWQETGRAALESQARDLIYDDGGFSQHSLNYHRVMLEDYLWAIQLARANGREFSSELVRRVGCAGAFLASLMDAETGRVPNWGSNDGARVLPLSNCDYLDYRPVVQAVARATTGRPALPPGQWDEQGWWLSCSSRGNETQTSRLAPPALPPGQNTETPAPGKPNELAGHPASALAPTLSPSDGEREGVRGAECHDFPDSGLTILRLGTARAVLRSPRRFRHRPGQCDLLHLDLWLGSENLLRDAGSYSYNAPDGAGAWFSSVAAHNTIQFDSHDQMPKLSRFLYGRWACGEVVLPTEDSGTAAASYTDYLGGRHERTVSINTASCCVTDRISGFQREAVLRWHLAPNGDWELAGTTCACPIATLRITVASGLKAIRLVEGWESLYYNEKAPLPMLEVHLSPSCSEVTTEILWS